MYREETTADGERVGQYSYIDNDGKTITVRYTAGRDGFRILEGDHVPTGANGQTGAAHVAEAPAPRAQAQTFAQQPQQQQFAPQQAAVDSRASNPDYDYYEDFQPQQPNFNPAAPAQNTFVDAQPAAQNFAPAQPAQRAQGASFNPFVNPHDPTHRNFQYNTNGGDYNTGNRGQAAPRQSTVPACADCAGVNPFINPYDASHRNPQAFLPAPTAAPRQQQFQPRQQQQQFQQQQFAAPVTQAPRNFFPPGQLQLNR